MGGYVGSDPCAELKTLIPELPGIMRRHGWGIASRLMDRWLAMPANSFPKQGIHDTTTVRMDWVRRFGRAWSVYTAAKANKVWVNEKAKKVIERDLIRKKGRLPQKVGERLEIGNVGEGLSGSGPGMMQFHDDWQVQSSSALSNKV
jgi:hypothetical protein